VPCRCFTPCAQINPIYNLNLRDLDAAVAANFKYLWVRLTTIYAIT